MRFLILSLLTLTVNGSIPEDTDLAYRLEAGPAEAEHIDLSDLLDVEPTEAPVEWCSWFDDADLRIHGLQISVNTGEALLEWYTLPLDIAQRMLNVSAARDLGLTPQTQRLVKRVYTITSDRIRIQKHGKDEFVGFLCRGFEKLRTQVKADTLNAILREYTGLVIAERATIEKRLFAERWEREGLIDTVRANTDQIRSCLEAQIDGSERALTEPKLQLGRMNQVVERSLQLRATIVDRMDQAPQGGWSREWEITLRVECIRSIKRIVIADGSVIAKELRSDLKKIARIHNLRPIAVIYPVYLETIDVFDRYIRQKHQPTRSTLETQIRDYETIIRESRGSIRQLLTYQP